MAKRSLSEEPYFQGLYEYPRRTRTCDPRLRGRRAYHIRARSAPCSRQFRAGRLGALEKCVGPFDGGACLLAPTRDQFAGRALDGQGMRLPAQRLIALASPAARAAARSGAVR